MNKYIITLSLVLLVNSQVPSVVYESFQHYITDFGKVYTDQTAQDQALDNYYQNFLKIQNWPTTYDYQLGQTPYMDLTNDNFKTQQLISIAQPAPSYGFTFYNDNTPTLSWLDVPNALNTNVYEQKECGNSWAFAVAAFVESYWRIQGTVVNLSVQQLIDCYDNTVDEGSCQQQWPQEALRWVQHNGLVTEDLYPYVDGKKHQCQTPAGDLYKINRITQINGDVNQIKKALKYRPVIVCYDGSQTQLYTGGQFWAGDNNENCVNNQANVCGLLIGYDEQNWIIKQSFSQKWGNSGLITIKQENCGVERWAYTAMTTDNEDIFPEAYQDFLDFKDEYQKDYPDQNEVYIRSHNFQDNYFAIQQKNMEVDSFQLGYTLFSDMTLTEFRFYHLNVQPVERTQNMKKYSLFGPVLRDIDWTNQGIVSPVQYMGECAASWAISTANAFESYFRQQTSVEVTISAQQLVDCVDGNDGCSGGFPDLAFQWIQDNGVTRGITYPYEGEKKTCQRTNGELKARNFISLETDQTGDNLKAALNKRPVVVCFDGTNLQNFGTGILDENGCSNQPEQNLCGLAVGYDDQSFKIKTSLGDRWGEDGYIRIKIGNICQVLVDPLFIEK